MKSPDPYAARHRFFEAAKNRVSLSSILIGLFVIEVAWFASGLFFAPWPGGETGSAYRTLAVHGSFLVYGAAAFWVVRRIQGRNPMAMIGAPRAAIGDFFDVLRVLCLLIGILYLLPGTAWEGATLARTPISWLMLLPLTCLAVLIQTAAEEIVFRGYLQQSIGALFDHPVAWMVGPSILFGLLHYNPEIPFDATLSHMIWTACFGLAAADLTARTGRLGAAIGLHLACNLPLVALVSTPGEVSGLSLLHYPQDAIETPRTALTLGFELFYLWMLWMACRIAIRR